jgi:8-oxo-dGTP diphosphatase
MSNAYETGSRKVIPAVLIYVRSADDKVLMIHRAGGVGGRGKPGDYHAGKWNGLGGKLEPDESPWQGARRELAEESGLKLSEQDLRLLGTLQFPNFKAHKNEDWICFVFTACLSEHSSQTRLAACEEGTLHWIPATDLLSLNLWPGDRHFIPMVVEEKPFAGFIRYQGQDVVEYRVDSPTQG